MRLIEGETDGTIDLSVQCRHTVQNWCSSARLGEREREREREKREREREREREKRERDHSLT